MPSSTNGYSRLCPWPYMLHLWGHQVIFLGLLLLYGTTSTATQVNLLELQGLIYAKKLIVEDAAGAFAKIAVAPLERVKNLLQARTGGFQSLGIIGSLRKLWKYK
ncbi:hypothetical protein QYE76_045047 [Lolium multiflorum]|uniref:Uncharacterized protein n=1 Tax=Lolium multiflorum TaxID=4521 RepID=A0AAD8WXN5_LOLMU|nr:hypothetical protein QYE76_045047 [Lolium multiflorum]